MQVPAVIAHGANRSSRRAVLGLSEELCRQKRRRSLCLPSTKKQSPDVGEPSGVDGEPEVGSRALALDGDERSEELANAGAARPPAGVVGAVDRMLLVAFSQGAALF